MASIVIAEKSSQAELYRKKVGTRFGRVLAASGHLFALAPPEEVNPSWKNWTAEILRPANGFYPNRISDARTQKLYREIKEAAKTADTIYVATDPDREGEGIGMDIVNALRREIKWEGRVLRVLQNATDEKTLREAFENAKPAETYKNLFQSFAARQQADHIFNLSLTRIATVLFRPDGWQGPMSVGRVMTPTFGMVCKRELDIRGFEPQDYFNPWIEVAGSAGRAKLSYSPPEKDRLFEREAADRIAKSAANYRGPIRVRKQQKKQAPPPLFSMAKLQVEAARRFKWSVKKTTDVLQKVYDCEAVTYPRSSETTLPEADIVNAPAMLAALQQIEAIGPMSWASSGPVIRIKEGAFHDKVKDAAHTAIVPNFGSIDRWGKLYAGMDPDERKLFELIARRYLAALAPDRIYDTTRLSVEVEKREFVANGTVEVNPGWREAIGIKEAPAREDDEDESEDSGSLPAFADGDAVETQKSGLTAKKTTAPPRFTDASLIIEMIEAWRHVEDPELRKILKETEGIGTEATRSRIVENLLKRKLIEVDGKAGGAIKASEAALQFYGILKAAAPMLLDVGLTGKMEMQLNKIYRGEAKSVAVVNEIVAVAEEALKTMIAAKNSGMAITAEISRPPTEGMKKAAKAKAQREGIKVPAGVLTDAAKCRAFLGPLPERGEGDGSRPPSDKQISYAQRIAVEQGIEIPAEILAEGKKLSDWITAHKGEDQKPATGKGPSKAPNRPKTTATAASRTTAPDEPTSKQVALAEKLAAGKRITVPDECYRSMALMRKFLDTHLGK